MPKIHDKNIIRLDIDEVARLLDEVESGESLTPRQQKYHDRTKTRDLALMTLLLGTGIRVSECVGLDLEDVDMRNNGIKIHRKGGAEVVVYFGEEVREALLAYMAERQKITAEDGSINALFLSLQNRRISVRSVENLVKKYAKLVTSLKHITPHKLRSTYAPPSIARRGISIWSRMYSAIRTSTRRGSITLPSTMIDDAAQPNM